MGRMRSRWSLRVLWMVLAVVGFGCDVPCDDPEPGANSRETARPLPLGGTDGFLCRSAPDVFEVEWADEEACAQQVVDLRTDGWGSLEVQIIDANGGLLRRVGAPDWNLAESATAIDPCASPPPRWVELRLASGGDDPPTGLEYTLLNLML